MAGMLQITFSGEAGPVNALHDHILAKMPRGPHGAIKHQPRLKQNTDGVTARLSLEASPEFCDVLFGEEWRSTKVAPAGGSTDGNSDDRLVNRYLIDYRANL